MDEAQELLAQEGSNAASASGQAGGLPPVMTGSNTSIREATPLPWVLGQLLPLCCPHLAPADRLAFFQCSKEVAGVIVDSAPCTHLTVRADTAALPTAMLLSMRPRSLALTLSGGLVVPETLRPLITSLTLNGATRGAGQHHLIDPVRGPLSAQDISVIQQQLQQLPQIEKFALVSWDFQAEVPQALHDHRPAVCTLECTDCVPSRVALASALRLLDTGRLQSLTGNIDALLPQLSRLPHLHRVCVNASPCPVAVVDETLRALLAHPTVKEVVCGWLPELTADLSQQPCNWDLLDLPHGAHMDSLFRLPLASIRCCRIRGHLYGFNIDDQGWHERCATLASQCPQLVCEPAMVVHAAAEVMAGFPHTAFVLNYHPFRVPLDPALHPKHLGRLITALHRHLVGPFILCHFKVSPTLLACLAACPPTVSMLGFKGCEFRCGPRGTRLESRDLLNHLPAHVIRVGFWDQPRECLFARRPPGSTAAGQWRAA